MVKQSLRHNEPRLFWAFGPKILDEHPLGRSSKFAKNAIFSLPTHMLASLGRSTRSRRRRTAQHTQHGPVALAVSADWPGASAAGAVGKHSTRSRATKHEEREICIVCIYIYILHPWHQP